MLDAWASERHYIDHLAPIWRALGSPGAFWAPEHLRTHAASRGVALTPGRSPGGSGPVMVASYRDEKTTGDRPVVLVEHGAGQDYGSANPAYPGGAYRDRVVLFVCPNESVAERNRVVYPTARFAVVGCPKLDPWHERPEPEGDALAVAFHWDVVGPGSVAPESRWALPHYLEALRSLARGREVLGHGHPRAWTRLARIYRDLGIEPVQDYEEVFRRARLLLFDNTSLGYEFASLDRPVVVLNAPWYRRSVEHGLRFWAQADLGPQVDEGAQIPGAIGAAEDHAARRREIVAEVYAYRDGSAANRAAQAIREALSDAAVPALR